MYPPDTAWIAFAYSLTLGVLPVVVYGAPVYALLKQKGAVSWPLVILLGTAPGGFLCLYQVSVGEDVMAGWFLIAGGTVTGLKHALNKRLFE